MKKSLLFLIAICSLSFLSSCGGGASMGPPPPPGCVNASSTVVCTQSGQVQGTIENNIRAFRGIPYAAPPVGNLRWRPPATPANWQGVRDATTFGNRCPQTDFNNGVQGNEDCLTLNIYAANPPSNSKQPVMVFFHGGGELLGDAQTPTYDLVPPLATHGVVVVTAQYRLGLLGFLAHPLLTTEGGGSSGNYALMDMIASLKWVRDNIGNFGGDSNRVMMFGQSAGSANVEALLPAPPAQGLFSAAAMESSAYTGGQLTGGLAGAYPFYAQLAPLVGCDTAADVLACLRALTAETIVLTELLPGKFPSIGWNIEPIVIPVDPFDKLQQQGSPVPLLIGSNREEATGLGEDPAAALTVTGYATDIHNQFDPLLAGAGNQVLALYPASAYDTPRYAEIDVESDFQDTCPTRVLARAVAGAQRPAVWRYFFTHRYKNNVFINRLRAFHTAELYFVFGNLEKLYYTETPYVPSAAEVTLSNEIMDYWARFATTGDPNGAGAAQWTRYDAANESVLELDETFSTLNGYHNSQCDYLSALPLPPL